MEVDETKGVEFPARYDFHRASKRPQLGTPRRFGIADGGSERGAMRVRSIKTSEIGTLS